MHRWKADDLQDRLANLLKEIGRVINGACEVGDVLAALQVLASLLLNEPLQNCPDQVRSDSSGLDYLNKLAASCITSAQNAFPKSSTEEILRESFYGGSSFSTLAQLLLHKVSLDWLACFSSAERAKLFDEFFFRAPPSETLLALVPALTTTHISDASGEDADNSSATRAEAERLLVLRFILQVGVKELALQSQLTQESQIINKGGRQSHLQSIVQVAKLVTSIPDRASFRAPMALRSPAYFQTVAAQLLSAAEDHWTAISSIKQDQRFTDLSSDGTFTFIGEVFGGLSRRGHAEIFALKMIPLLLQHVSQTCIKYSVERVHTGHSCLKYSLIQEGLQFCFWPVLIASIKDQHARERLTEALLKGMAKDQSLTDWDAYCILNTLYADFFQAQSAIRVLFTEKFLLWKVLPPRSMKWILDFAVLCSPPCVEIHGETEILEKQQQVQISVLRSLVEAWSTKEFIQSASLEQQGYLTAAVGISISAMNKEGLERTQDLLQLLLQGISNRLDSPLSPVRQMAKRVALAFSLVMNKNNPLLLDDEDTIEDLCNWEGLQLFGSDTVGQSKNDRCNKADNDSKKLEEVESKDDVGALKRREKRQQRKERKEQLALEEDDPDEIVRLGTGEFEDSEGSVESDTESETSLVPYDMSDNEEDLQRGKFPTQIAELTSNLRKGDDAELVERALQVAEKLVRAVPEELENMSEDLAHALVHVKCGNVTMEGDEDFAEEQRHRALVALLSCSPINTVIVLTREFYSNHVDVSQRILVLDVMADGARELAAGTDTEISSYQRHAGSLIADMQGTSSHQLWYGPGSTQGPKGAGPWVEVASLTPSELLVGWAYKYERELPPKEGQRNLGKSRRWGHRTKQLRQESRLSGGKQSKRNKFAPLAAAFMLPLMRDYDRKKPGLDLLGRDFHILGKLLYMLGICVECIAMEPEVSLLGPTLLEMLKSRAISSHVEPFVRRSALFAASRVLVALHPSVVIASFIQGDSSMAENLEWLREWALKIANNDPDTECSMMAVVCVQLHAEMALQATRSMKSASPDQLLENGIQISVNPITPMIRPTL